jgi:hypothetical protein
VFGLEGRQGGFVWEAFSDCFWSGRGEAVCRFLTALVVGRGRVAIGCGLGLCSGLSELRPSEVVMAMDSLERIAVGLARASW